jgi:S-adenosylmethionine:tRNA ribosyltransferase-isomerase
LLLTDFDYVLPPQRIAQQPAEPRDQSKLLVLSRSSGSITADTVFREVVSFVEPGDLLVLNETKVTARRLFATSPHGGKIELFLTHRIAPGVWQALVRPGRKLQKGATIELNQGLRADIVDKLDDRGGRIVNFHSDNGRDIDDEIDCIGRTPLPPYISQNDESDANVRRQYQTVYARNPGSAAAPTAGLHFTDSLLELLAARGVKIARLTLHVGIGTFRPIKSESIEDHKMHSEEVEIPESTATAIAETTGSIVAVGTTALRALESAAYAPRRIRSGHFSTDLYVTPGYEFKVADSLITNFHMPRSTLLVLVSAFVGRDNLMAAYAYGLTNGFRFLSFGDAMYIRNGAKS